MISAKHKSHRTHVRFQRIPLCNRQPISLNESQYTQTPPVLISKPNIVSF